MMPNRPVHSGPQAPRASAPRDSLPFSPPSASEQDALRRAAAYLQRAGNEVGSRALMPDFAAAPGWAAGRNGPGAAQAGFLALQESLRAAAALCDGVAETSSPSPAGR